MDKKKEVAFATPNKGIANLTQKIGNTKLSDLFVFDDLPTDEKQRGSFVFFSSFAQLITKLPEESQHQMLVAIVNYAFFHIDTDFGEDLLLDIAWTAIKKDLDFGWKQYKNGSKGGAPMGNKNAQKQPKTTQNQATNNLKQPYRIEKDRIEKDRIEKDKRESNENALSLSQEEFKEECMSFVGKHPYTKELVAEFYRYYSMPTPDGRILKETLPAWDTETKLHKWYKNERNK